MMRSPKKILLLFLFALYIPCKAQFCFSGPTNFAYFGGPNYIATGDFNNDGKVDVASTHSGQNVTVILGNGLGSFPVAQTFSTALNPSGIVAADLNNDGNLDLALTTIGLSDTRVEILLGNGAGSFTSNTTFTTFTNPRSLINHDFNGDGNQDLAVAMQSYSVSTVCIYFGNGQGGFGPPTIHPVDYSPHYICKGDFNNDGVMDIATANYSGYSASVLIGNGFGGFAAAVNYPTGALPCYIESSDVNADGNKDLLVTNTWSGSVSVLLGNGAGSFSLGSTIIVGQNPWSTSCADYNGDGIIDMAVARYSSNDVGIFLGAGNGVFWSPISYSLQTGANHVVNSDLNGDGRNDLIVSNVTSNAVSVLLNVAFSVTANATSTYVCPGSTVALTGSGANTYTWSGGVSNGVPFSATATNIYTVTGTNTLGCNASNTIQVIAAGPPLTISGSTAVCAGNNTTTLIAGGANTYTWSTGSTSPTITLSPSVTTNYTLYGIDISGCPNTRTFNVIVNTTPTISASASSTLFCAGVTSTLSANGALTYSWSNGATSSVVVVSPSTSITYTVVGINIGCPTDSKTLAITVNATPILTVNPTSTLLCAGQTQILNCSGASSYLWNTGSSNPSIAVSPTVNTIYTVNGLFGNGCVATKTIPITVGITPSLNVSATSSVMCQGYYSLLSVSGCTNFVWSTGNTVSPVFVTPTVTTIYTVTGTNLGCPPVVQTITIQVNPLPTVTITANSWSICASEQITLTASGALSYTWGGGQISSSIVDAPIHTITYYVQGTNSFGCTGSCTYLVGVFPCVGTEELSGEKIKVEVFPNPNSGQFTVRINEHSGNYSLTVLNLIGQKVFETKIERQNSFVNISELPRGIYTLLISGANEKLICGKVSIE
jgi:hypothetical protein